MTKRMLIDAAHVDETRVVIADRSYINDFDFVTSAKKQIKGNIYLAKITRVEPSLQAAFVEYGGGKQGFLPFAEIHPDYYQIPMADRARLMQEAEEAASAPEENAPEEGAPEGMESHAGISAPKEEASSAILSSDIVDEATPLTQSFSEEPAADPAEDLNIITALPTFLERAIEELPETPADETVHSQVPEREADFNENPAMREPQTVSLAVTDYITSAPEFTWDTSNDNSGQEDNASIPSENHTDVQPSDNPSPAAQTESIQTPEETETSDSEESERKRRRFFTRRYKIQEVIKRGQIILVQVIKEERGNKGVSLSTYISLAGRYCVLMPNSPKDGGISRKIQSSEDRRRLRMISEELRLAAGMSAIIRTAGMDRSHAEIKRDFDYLVRLWNTVRERVLSSTAPALIYEESDLIKRSIRDLYNNDIDEVIVEGEQAFNDAKDFMKMMMPSHAPRVKQHKDGLPLFYEYEVEEQLLAMHDPVVKLRSGGYIVINPTEALISIDVNSGRATGERNIEETASKTNLEAANEIARQLRLRDLAGLIVIDFIDMLDGRNRRGVERALKDALRHDRAKIQVGRISPFGLMEMSRQRMRSSISEASMIQCSHCEGRGVVRSNESMGIQVIRAIEKEVSAGGVQELRVVTSAETAMYLFNNRRADITAIEKQFLIRIVMDVTEGVLENGFKIERIRQTEGGKRYRKPRGGRNDRPGVQEAITPDSVAPSDDMLPEDFASEATQDTSRNSERNDRGERTRRGRGRRGRRTFRDRDATPLSPENGNEPATATPASNPAPADIDSERNERRPRREGRNRGRRQWRDKPNSEAPVLESSPNTSSTNDFAAPTSTHYVSSAPSEFRLDVPANHSAVLEKELEAAKTQLQEQKPESSKRGWWRRIVE